MFSDSRCINLASIAACTVCIYEREIRLHTMQIHPLGDRITLFVSNDIAEFGAIEEIADGKCYCRVAHVHVNFDREDRLLVSHFHIVDHNN